MVTPAFFGHKKLTANQATQGTEEKLRKELNAKINSNPNVVKAQQKYNEAVTKHNVNSVIAMDTSGSIPNYSGVRKAEQNLANAREHAEKQTNVEKARARAKQEMEEYEELVMQDMRNLPTNNLTQIQKILHNIKKGQQIYNSQYEPPKTKKSFFRKFF